MTPNQESERPACCLTEAGLECICCTWHGCEETATAWVDEKNLDDGVQYQCPVCGELCAHTPINETTDYEGPCVCV